MLKPLGKKMAGTVQVNKRTAKEASRKQVLEGQLFKPAYSQQACDNTAKLLKATKSAAKKWM